MARFYMRCFARFSIICTILKKVKITRGGVLILVKLQALRATVTLSIFHVFKIVQM